MNKQLEKRICGKAVARYLERFNNGEIDAGQACLLLSISRAHLYRLRTEWLRRRDGFTVGVSGGDHMPPWPKECADALRGMLVSSRGAGERADYQFFADELSRRLGFTRDRSCVRRFCEGHFKGLLCLPEPEPHVLRRWSMADYGALWQHDSTPVHFWGAPGDRQSLIMTIDDATRKIVGCRVCGRETLAEHFGLFFEEFSALGTPAALYTDGFTMFGREGEDIKTGCGRALRAFNIHHLIAKTPQAKGKIERTMRTFQHRLAAAAAAEGAADPAAVNRIGRAHCTWWNANHVNEETGLTPDRAAARLIAAGRTLMSPPPPQAILKLFLAIHERRAVICGNSIQFLGRIWSIAPTAKTHVWLAIRPKGFYVLGEEPDPTNPRVPTILARYPL